MRLHLIGTALISSARRSRLVGSAEISSGTPTRWGATAFGSLCTPVNSFDTTVRSSGSAVNCFGSTPSYVETEFNYFGTEKNSFVQWRVSSVSGRARPSEPGVPSVRRRVDPVWRAIRAGNPSIAESAAEDAPRRHAVTPVRLGIGAGPPQLGRRFVPASGRDSFSGARAAGCFVAQRVWCGDSRVGTPLADDQGLNCLYIANCKIDPSSQEAVFRGAAAGDGYAVESVAHVMSALREGAAFAVSSPYMCRHEKRPFAQ